MKIVNIKKFLRSIIVIFLLILGVSLLISNKSFSHEETKYKTICVSNGDTLWSIAKDEKEFNSYYEDKDIRDIVASIKATNHLSSSELKINQKLVIPSL